MSSPPTIGADLPCVSCGYNLRTLPLDACCPECGSPVRATRTDFFFHWDTRRLSQLIKAVRLLIAVTTGLAAAMILFMVILVTERIPPHIGFVLVAFGLVLTALNCQAVFALPPLGAAPGEMSLTPLKVLSLVSLFTMVCLLPWPLVLSASDRFAVNLICMLAGVSFVSFGICMSVLGTRLSDVCIASQWRPLAQSIRWYLGAEGVSIALLGAALIMAPLPPLIGICGCGASLVLLFVPPFTIISLVKLQARLRAILPHCSSPTR